jgi:hypothetical protein
MPYRTMKPIDPPPPVLKKLSEFPDTVAGLRALIYAVRDAPPGSSHYGLYWQIKGSFPDERWFPKLVAALGDLERRIIAIEHQLIRFELGGR